MIATGGPATGQPATSLAAARDELEHVLRGLAAGGADRRGSEQPRVLAAVVPVDPIDPLTLFSAIRESDEDGALWLQPMARFSLVAAGVAATIPVVGPDRFVAAAEAWRILLTEAAVGGRGVGRRGAAPLLIGGATFADRAATDPRWSGFEHGRLELPAILLGTSGDEATLSATVALDPDADSESVIGEVLRQLDVLAATTSVVMGTDPVERPGGDGPAMLRIIRRAPDFDEWCTSVARSAGAVGRGRIDKVVLGRRVDLASTTAIDPTAVLRRLERSASRSTIFAFARGRRTFLGATPERLLETRGRTFRTIALAGTAARGVDEATDLRLAEELLASEKDREEHAVVVGMLRETLAPLTDRLDIGRTPHVVRLPTVQHLATEVSGEVRDDEGILGLVGRLHPTPAVGGWPRDAALYLIDEQEHIDRGWYAGPVGWLDADGDGEFVVAIRSGIVAGREASMFAGCGIVADSEPGREWDESEMKLRALASALGRVER
jgi:menaquinone-specific isochorismate synthase